MIGEGTEGGRRARRATDKPARLHALLKSFQDLGLEEKQLGEPFEAMRSIYAALTEEEQLHFFQEMIAQVEVSKDTVSPLLESLRECGDHDPRWPRLLAQLRQKMLSPRLRRFRKLARTPGGLKFLLDLRGDILSVQRDTGTDLTALDADIVFLLEMWFQEGFLYLEEITLDSSYRQIELIKNNDMVHPMSSIEEMGRRLGKDRHCLALYHRLLPYEPVIFIEVALTSGLARSMEDIMAPAREGARVNTAIFYSINNTQNGLAGLGLGKLLLGEVVDYLRRQDESINTFATLSPIPGLWDRYLRRILEGRDSGFKLKQSDVYGHFSKKTAAAVCRRAGLDEVGVKPFCTALAAVLADEAWASDEGFRKELQAPLTRIAYFYLTEEKTARGKPLNPVANFHLGNGATVGLRNVNFLANPSPRGLQESCGLMVNYIYSSDWLGQIRRTFHWFEHLEVKGIFRRR